jgi:transposase
LHQIRESAQALFAQGKVDETWELFLAALEAVLVKNRELELLVAKLRRERLGPKSERLDLAQLSLLLEALGESAEAAAASDSEADAREAAELERQIASAEQTLPVPPRPRRKAGPGWQTRGIERQVHEVDVPLAQQTCADCGRAMKRIGADVTRQLAYVPAHFVEHEYHRAKYACGRCKEGVTTAPGPVQVLERSAADASLLAHLIVSKYADHLPLHRVSRIYARSGVTLPVSTLADWMARSADHLAPLGDLLAARVLAAGIVRTDATGLRVLDPQSAGHIQRGSLWVYVGDDRDVLFRYTPTGEGATGPWQFLAGRTGYIQADAASVFDRLFDGQAATAIELGCWAHGRRRLVALQDTDCRAAYPLTLIARLYRIEHLADARQLTPDARADLRQERSAPVLDRLQRWFALTRATEPPSTDLARAAGYALNHWAALTRFLVDGRISLDNNVCEQQLRDVALGRKNFLFAGSHAAARRAAVLYSLTRTCAQYGVPPLPYFTDVLTKLAHGSDTSRLADLLPHRWRLEDATAQSALGP